MSVSRKTMHFLKKYIIKVTEIDKSYNKRVIVRQRYLALGMHLLLRFRSGDRKWHITLTVFSFRRFLQEKNN